LRNDGDALQLRGEPGSEPARALLIAGKPLGEPIAQHGPFVMNTREQLIAAVEDFQAGKMG
jgi:redox-sensitive bicupin YhaK (pirin superfamily)